MIDLTPLDVRKKRGDFGKALRGYDPGEVDTFLELVAERMEELVKENITYRERVDRLQEQVVAQSGRESAVQEALVTAQELRKDVGEQARREAEMIRSEAERDAERILADADREVRERREALEELERKRLRFLRAFRGLLERELDVVGVEEGRTPLQDVAVELELGGGRESRTSRHSGAVSETPETPETPGTPGAPETRKQPEAVAEWSEPSDPPPLENVPPAGPEGSEGSEGSAEGSDGGAVEPLPDPAADVHELASQVENVFGGSERREPPAAAPDLSVPDTGSGPAGGEPGSGGRGPDPLWLPSLMDEEPEDDPPGKGE